MCGDGEQPDTGGALARRCATASTRPLTTSRTLVVATVSGPSWRRGIDRASTALRTKPTVAMRNKIAFAW